MNKIKQNKITFTLILIAILVTFSSLTFLSLPVLFNYESKVTKIEKNFYKKFKLNLNISGNISYKPFPKPHLLVEKASLKLSQSSNEKNIINTENLKIFISLRDLYLRSFKKLIYTEISNTNIRLQLSDLIKLREHLYKKINNPIILVNCKLFLKNKDDDVILISQINKVTYKINKKNKNKRLLADGSIFGIKYKSDWKRNYDTPDTSVHNFYFLNPNIEFKNIFKYEDKNNFEGNVQINYSQNKLEYYYVYGSNKIKLNSPENKNLNFAINSNINLNPFYFDGELILKNKKIEQVIDNFLLKFFLYDEKNLGNFSGNLKIKFNDLKNKLIKKGEINFDINENKIHFKNAKFILDKIGFLSTDIKFKENNGDIKFLSKNELIIDNYIEFAKIFQIGSKKAKNINKIYFDLERNVGSNDLIIKNIKINNYNNSILNNQIFIVKNIQNLRSSIRKVID